MLKSRERERLGEGGMLDRERESTMEFLATYVNINRAEKLREKSLEFLIRNKYI
jgi:hypothetical protein